MNRLKNLIRLLSILVILSGGGFQVSAGSRDTSAGHLAVSDAVSLTNFRFGGHTGGQLGPLAVQGGYAYVGVGPILAVLDVSDPADIHRIGSILVGKVNDIALADGKAYLATESGLQVVTLSDPAAPRLVGASESFYAVKVAVQSNYVFLIEQEWSDAAPRLRIYSVGDPYSPVLVGTYTFFSDPKFWLFMRMSGLQVSANYAYLTYGGLIYDTAAGSLVVIDVSEMANPQLAGELQMNGINDIKVIGSTAYLTTWSASSSPNSSPGSLVTVYLADPAHLQVRGSYTAECYPDGVCPSLDRLVVAGSYAYVKSDGLRVLDISDPANPFLVDKIPASGKYVAQDSDSVYLTGPEGLQAFSLDDPAAPALAGDYHPLFRNAFDVAVSDYYAYLAADDGLHILDPSPPWDMIELAHATVSGQKLALMGNILYLANQYGLQVVDVTIEPLREPQGMRGMVVIVFADVAAPSADMPSHKRPHHHATVDRLEEALRHAREEVRSTREEMQTSQEELKSANEELQSTNEELQSTNEELTTSKEEMQSLNEELQTLNHELQAKVDDESRANDDMRNLLDSTDIATLFLDDALKVRRFTPRMTKIIKLIPGDVNRPITDLASDLIYPKLAADARAVLRTLVFKETPVKTVDERWFSVRIMPYRTLDNRIDGLVITFADITAAKTLEATLRQNQST